MVDESSVVGRVFTDQRPLFQAIETGDVEGLREVCRREAWLVREHMLPQGPGEELRRSWIVYAARKGDVKLVEAMLDIGFSVHGRDEAESGGVVEGRGRALDAALELEDQGMARMLLSRGADPNAGMTPVRLMYRKDVDRVLADLELFLAHGLKVNWAEKYDARLGVSTPLDMSSSKRVSAFLKERGGKRAYELVGEAASCKPRGRMREDGTREAEEVREVLMRLMGQGYGEVLVEPIAVEVRGGLRMEVYMCKPRRSFRRVTLFTFGLSEWLMEGEGDRIESVRSELYVHLNEGWKPRAGGDAKHGSAVKWLLDAAFYLHGERKWVDGGWFYPAAPEKRAIWPGARCECAVGVPMDGTRLDVGTDLKLWRMSPMHASEREYALGGDGNRPYALMAELTEHGTSADWVDRRRSIMGADGVMRKAGWWGWGWKWGRAVWRYWREGER
jgi:hypothetical protein